MTYRSNQPVLNQVIEVRRTNFLTSLYYKLHPEWKNFGRNTVVRYIHNFYLIKSLREEVIKNVIS